MPPQSKPSHADDCEKVINMLDGPPSTLEDIGTRCGLPTWVVNNIVCSLRLNGQVAMTTERVKGKGKVNLYTLKTKAA